MKKSVLALLILLAVLIVTCIYDKTYTIYSTSPKKLTLVERKTTARSESTVKTDAVEKKEEKTSILPVISVATPTKDTEVNPEPETKPAVKTDKTVEIQATAAETKSMKELMSFYQEMKNKKDKETATLSAEAVPAITTKEVTTPKPVVTKKSKKENTHEVEPVTQNTGEKEIADYIMWALNNRDIAIKNRDEVEARIQELITQALNDRKVALADRKVVLDERSKNEIALENMQTELIDARDASYESVTNPKTTNQGEK